jgi:hypothetical protein
MDYRQVPESAFKNFEFEAMRIAQEAKAAAAAAEQKCENCDNGAGGRLPAVVVTSDTTLGTTTLVKADATGGNIVLTLPPAGSSLGQVYIIVRTDFAEAFVSVEAAAGEMISYLSGQGIGLMQQGRFTHLVCIGADGWIVLSGETNAPG